VGAARGALRRDSTAGFLDGATADGGSIRGRGAARGGDTARGADLPAGVGVAFVTRPRSGGVAVGTGVTRLTLGSAGTVPPGVCCGTAATGAEGAAGVAV
jgi:hypothetical protein